MAQSPVERKPELRISRHYAVAPEKVWRAWTEPQALMRWFGPAQTQEVTAAEIDLQVGGRWRIAFRTGDGQQHAVSGVYQEVELHRRLVFSWAWQSTPDRVSLVSVSLRPDQGGCTLDFLHERFFDVQARNNHERGWTGTFTRLDALLGAQPATQGE
jgi:uncharacterized protein YndB with AHSA1/START domain